MTADPVSLRVRLASGMTDERLCQAVIARVYGLRYGVTFSHHDFDLEAKVERFPHRYLMGWVGDELVAACGIYLRDTYVERYGKLDRARVAAVSRAAGRRDVSPLRELTKLSVVPEWTGRGLGEMFFRMIHARDFMQIESGEHHPFVVCATRAIFGRLFEPAGIRTRLLGPFPRYTVHEAYRSPENPMESRMLFPELDVPPRIYRRPIPGDYPVTPRVAARPTSRLTSRWPCGKLSTACADSLFLRSSHSALSSCSAHVTRASPNPPT